MYRQVMRDVKVAAASKLITSGQAASIGAMQKELLRVGFLRKKMETRRSKLLFLFTNILFNNKIKRFSKIDFIKRTLLKTPTLSWIYRLYKGSSPGG